MSAAAPLDAPVRSPTAGEVSRLGELLTLAKSRSTADRQRLLLGIAALCDSAPPGFQTSEVLGEIFITLAGQAERDIRRVLAEQLAGAAWAPPALINMLALDEIDIARPIITSSPLLKDPDLLRILIEATVEHGVEVARRPALSGHVVDAIIDRGEPGALTALAGNRSAEISVEGMRRLVDHSRRVAGLRAPLTRHPALTEALARQMVQWVGEALRQSIADRFRVDPASLAVAIDTAVDRVAPSWTSQRASGPEEAERLEMERRLVAKLQAANQLKPAFLVRAVRERRLGLFEHALAALGGFSLAQVRRAARATSPQALYLACTAIGVDRAVFGPLLDDIRKLSGGLPGQGGAWMASPMTAESAAAAFRELMDSLESSAA